MPATKKKPDLKDVLGGNFNFGRMAEDIMGFVLNAGTEGRERAKGEIEKLLHKMELVSRREFEAVRDIATTARAHAEELAEMMGQKLQNAAQASRAARGGTKTKSAAKKKTSTAAKKPAAKKPAVKKTPAKKKTTAKKTATK